MRIGRKALLCSSLSLAANGLFLAQRQTAENSPRPGFPVIQASGDAPLVPSQIAAPVDEARLARLHGNTHPNARAEFDKGRDDGQLPMERMILVLKRGSKQDAALKAFMARQLDPTSPDFHHWLGPEESGRIYGPSENDISAVGNWLQNHASPSKCRMASPL
ncbi:protease pro-enzyme activation domain-containing protein [Telmatobacter sp. DSM 110680]|uniref:Protease pro-enzyme activation domain-containing protein n=1 Tax=Telmatobacter sp. DSM 110680 TaxID=3036704 RepID=A0AAU7DDM0_9BACT